MAPFQLCYFRSLGSRSENNILAIVDFDFTTRLSDLFFGGLQLASVVVEVTIILKLLTCLLLDLTSMWPLLLQKIMINLSFYDLWLINVIVSIEPWNNLQLWLDAKIAPSQKIVFSFVVHGSMKEEKSNKSCTFYLNSAMSNKMHFFSFLFGIRLALTILCYRP